jgi:hypothetical protein
METAILKAEADLARAENKTSTLTPECSADDVTQAMQELGDAQEVVDRLYARWSELTAKGTT